MVHGTLLLSRSKSPESLGNVGARFGAGEARSGETQACREEPALSCRLPKMENRASGRRRSRPALGTVPTTVTTRFARFAIGRRDERQNQLSF